MSRALRRFQQLPQEFFNILRRIFQSNFDLAAQRSERGSELMRGIRYKSPVACESSGKVAKKHIDAMYDRRQFCGCKSFFDRSEIIGRAIGNFVTQSLNW